MIDQQGYRANVGIILADGQGQVMWCKRLGQDAWQFPQGGVAKNESCEQAMYRELKEEVGLNPSDVDLLDSTQGWLRYRLPKRMVRHGTQPICIGQKQRWFLLRLKTDSQAIELNQHLKPEFDHWEWVSYWYPLEQVVSFKKEVYRKALKELAKAHNCLVSQHA